MSSPIPNFPPLSGIADANTRAVLQAIIDQLRVRNGEVGSGDQRFLTVADLQPSDAQNLNAVGGVTSGSRRYGAVTGAINSLIDGAVSRVLESKLMKALGERIAWVESPAWFQGKFGAEIKQEQLIREEADKAVARNITTAVSRVSENLALAQQELTAISEANWASASAVTQLQTEIGDVRVAAQQAFTLSQSHSGDISSAWTVKVDVNGYVAGFGLGVDGKSGAISSAFGVLADRFFVAHPGGGATVPFVVEGGRVFMNSAVIKEASINTLQVAGGAITVPEFIGPGITNTLSGSYTVPGKDGEKYKVFILCHWTQNASAATIKLDVIQGATVYNQWTESSSPGSLVSRAVVAELWANLPYTLSAYSDQGADVIVSIFALATKR